DAPPKRSSPSRTRLRSDSAQCASSVTSWRSRKPDVPLIVWNARKTVLQDSESSGSDSSRRRAASACSRKPRLSSMKYWTISGSKSNRKGRERGRDPIVSMIRSSSEPISASADPGSGAQPSIRPSRRRTASATSRRTVESAGSSPATCTSAFRTTSSSATSVASSCTRSAAAPSRESESPFALPTLCTSSFNTEPLSLRLLSGLPRSIGREGERLEGESPGAVRQGWGEDPRLGRARAPARSRRTPGAVPRAPSGAVRRDPGLRALLARPALLAALRFFPEAVELLERCLTKRDAPLSGEALEGLEATGEFLVRVVQRVERVSAGETCEVDDGEEEVAELLLECGRGLGLERLADLFELFGDLFESAPCVRPVEADGAHTFLNTVGARQRLEPARDPVEDRVLSALLRLERLPVLRLALAVEMRVPPAHLRSEALDDGLGIERPPLLGEDDLERKV